MKKLVLGLFLLFGIAFSCFSKQNVVIWKATTQEDVEHRIDWCQFEIKLLLNAGYSIVSVAFTEDGYLIVYEDWE